MTPSLLSRPFRMLRIDYVPDFSIVQGLNPEDVFRALKEDWKINCVWLVGTIGFNGLGYVTTFNTYGYEKYDKLSDFDYLRTYIPYAKKYDINVIAYMNMHWYRYNFADKHTEWEQTLSDGRKYGRVMPLYGKGSTFCVNSPWRDWACGLIEEVMKTGVDGVFLDGPIFFPGCCYCEYCKKLFREQFNADIPKEDWNNPLWKNFIEFRDKSLVRFLKDVRERAKKVNSEGIIFLNSGGWAPSNWRVARDIQLLNPYQDICGAEAFFHYTETHNIYDTLMMGKYLRAGKKPAIVFTHYMNGKWHYLNLPAGEVKRSIVQIAASGANHWLASLWPSLEYQPESNVPVKELFEILAKNETYFKDITPIADVGLVFSSTTGKYWLSRIEDIYKSLSSEKEEDLIVNLKETANVDWAERKKQCERMLHFSYEGYFKTLTRNHILFDILLDQDLSYEVLKKYKVIIFPDSQCLKEKSAYAIRQYIEEGGNATFSFEAGMYDEKGNQTDRLFDLLGIKQVEGAFDVMLGENYIKITKQFIGFRKGELIERSDYALKVIPNQNVDIYGYFLNPLDAMYIPLKGVSNYPAIMANNVGKGKVFYFAEAIGRFIQKTGMLSAERRIADSVKELISTPTLSTNAPKTVSMELYKQENRFILHIMNNTVDHQPINEFVPIRNIKIRLNSKKGFKKVYPVVENTNVRTETQSGELVIIIPEIKLYEMVVMELADGQNDP